MDWSRAWFTAAVSIEITHFYPFLAWILGYFAPPPFWESQHFRGRFMSPDGMTIKNVMI